MKTSNNLEQQCAQAMQRINESINRSAGQHKRRVKAGQPVKADALSLHRVDPATVQPYTPAFAASPEEVTAMDLLIWAAVAIGATACAVILAFAIGYQSY